MNVRSSRAERRRPGAEIPGRAFTLLEVMVAIGIFCVAIFAILEVVTQNLRMARSLQHQQVDAGALAAELSLTNRLEEGSEQGDFGKMYPGCRWSREITEVASNGFFQVDFTVHT